MTAPNAETFFVCVSIRSMEAWMYAASETSPAAQPKLIGRNVPATFQAWETCPDGGFQYGRYQTMSNVSASNRSQGIGVLTKFVSKKTNNAPSSSPKFDPPTCFSQSGCAHFRMIEDYHDLRPRRTPEIPSGNLRGYAILQISMAVKSNRIAGQKPDELATRE